MPLHMLRLLMTVCIIRIAIVAITSIITTAIIITDIIIVYVVHRGSLAPFEIWIGLHEGLSVLSSQICVFTFLVFLQL